MLFLRFLVNKTGIVSGTKGATLTNCQNSFAEAAKKEGFIIGHPRYTGGAIRFVMHRDVNMEAVEKLGKCLQHFLNDTLPNLTEA